MISSGVDAYKGAHVAVAFDAGGQWQGANSAEGSAGMHAWAQGLGDERHWGIEGAWNYGRGVAQHLVAADEAVYDVNARPPLRSRPARNRSKSDLRDAQAIALYVWREGTALPPVLADDATAVLEVLVS